VQQSFSRFCFFIAQLLFQQYVIALKTASAGLLLSDIDKENLFGNIKEIYVFNRCVFSFAVA